MRLQPANMTACLGLCGDQERGKVKDPYNCPCQVLLGGALLCYLSCYFLNSLSRNLQVQIRYDNHLSAFVTKGWHLMPLSLSLGGSVSILIQNTTKVMLSVLGLGQHSLPCVLEHLLWRIHLACKTSNYPKTTIV